VTLYEPDTDKLDLEAQALWFSYLGKRTGLAGLVVLGTNAETFLLTREERRELLVLARRVLGPNYPIMAGVGGHSTRQVEEFIADAVDAGADYVLVLPPGYFKVADPVRVRQVVEGFYSDVSRAAAAESEKAGREVGVVVYNFPGVCNGVDLDRYEFDCGCCCDYHRRVGG
jgi:dihydrodipicolinate synthase/N-acetylneuraminate lyase